MMLTWEFFMRKISFFFILLCWCCASFGASSAGVPSFLKPKGVVVYGGANRTPDLANGLRGLVAAQPLAGGTESAFHYVYLDGADVYGLHMSVDGTIGDVALGFGAKWEGVTWKGEIKCPYFLATNDASKTFNLYGADVSNCAATHNYGEPFQPIPLLTIDNSVSPNSIMEWVGDLWVDHSISYNGSLINAKACATGYSRVSPNLCMKTSNFGTTSLTRDLLTTLTDPASDSKALIIAYQLYNLSSGAAEQLVSSLEFKSNSIIQFKAESWAMGYTITPAGYVIGSSVGQAVLVKNTNYQLLFSDDTGNLGQAKYEIRGYID